MLFRRSLKGLTDSSARFTAFRSRPSPLAFPEPIQQTQRYTSSPWRFAVRNSSSSSKRWQNRQGRDVFSREAKVQGLKSRAAFKLLEINERYKIFTSGQTVVDLGYAPGSWSQVAVDRTAPNGRVVGIDIIPAQPPKGASTLQGNFLSRAVQEELKNFLRDPDRGRPRLTGLPNAEGEAEDTAEHELGYVDMERRADLLNLNTASANGDGPQVEPSSKRKKDDGEEKMVDVVLSDMMMNTSGMNFRDHAGSMDLCGAALSFAFDTLRTGGHFVCKFYQGSEEKALEARLKTLFSKVHREKPESSRTESREAYFVALRRKGDAKRGDVLGDQ